EVAILEQIADQSPRSRVDDDRVWFGKGLQSRREIRGLSGDSPLLCLTYARKTADNNQTGTNADASLQPFACLEVEDSLDLSQARTHRSLGIIFMGLRIPEIGQQAIAHISGDKAIVPTDRFGGALLVRTQNLAQVLGIEARREPRRVDNIAEHNRDLPSL